MNVNYTFINEKFTINPDVYFTVDTTVINGHRICKLKTLNIHYHGEIFEMTVGSVVYKYFIQFELQSIFSIELINYLNRFINHEILYDIYFDELKIGDLSSNSTVLRPQHRNNQQEISSFIIHDKSNEFFFKINLN